MALHRFTDRWIQAHGAPPKGRAEYADAMCPGLHLRVTGNGTKTFSAMIRVNGRLQRRTLGRYPKLSLAEARAETLQMLRVAAEGVDPRQPTPETYPALTYAELVEDFFTLHLERNARSCNDIKASLMHPGLRQLRTRPAAGIVKRDILTGIDGIVAKGTPQAAVNVLRRLKMLFNWAVERDILPVNPCNGIRPPARTVERDRVLSDSEIAAVWGASHQLPAPYGQMYRMFLLTGQRRSEVATMQWRDVTGDVWVIPSENVKKNRTHVVPLSKTAAATLASLPCYGRDAFVFTTTGGKSASSNFAKTKAQIDLLSGVTGWVIHDLRRTVRSKLAELGVSREVARKVLNHEDGKIDRIYNRHEYLAEKREALERWEEKLTGLASNCL